jgi:hypothetical protein
MNKKLGQNITLEDLRELKDRLGAVTPASRTDRSGKSRARRMNVYYVR